jgi:hypothetical protein
MHDDAFQANAFFFTPLPAAILKVIQRGSVPRRYWACYDYAGAQPSIEHCMDGVSIYWGDYYDTNEY